VPFNWALDWFDGVLAASSDSRDRCALHIVETATGADTRVTFLDLSRRSNQTANFLRHLGIRRGDHVLMVLGNVQPLWEIMLACMKLGAVLIPATTLASSEELADRIERGSARLVIAGPDQVAKLSPVLPEALEKIVVGGAPSDGWHAYDEVAKQMEEFRPDGPTAADDPMLLYFTSGTTAKPKLVLHSHRSYPVGALSTMYWLGLQPCDIHINVSSPGWAKHAWSSFFAPWNAGATVLVVNQPRFEAKVLLHELVRCAATTLCAPPTVWRLLAQEDLARYRVRLREVCAAGEPLNPEMIDRVSEAWGLTIRDGYGQTETTALVANSPGQPVKAGAMGRPMPGYTIAVLDPDGHSATEGEVCVELGSGRPAGLMLGYRTEEGLKGVSGVHYRTSDVAFVDEDGYLAFVGRADDVFKSSDYRISPFELESVLVEHPDVLETAVIPAPDPIRLTVPKAYVILRAGLAPDRATALSILRHANARLAPYKRIRKLEIVPELPKTISGKIKRAQLRRMEGEAATDAQFRGMEFNEADFPELKGG
jgi:acetyl-CoA synthetase